MTTAHLIAVVTDPDEVGTLRHLLNRGDRAVEDEISQHDQGSDVPPLDTLTIDELMSEAREYDRALLTAGGTAREYWLVEIGESDELARIWLTLN